MNLMTAHPRSPQLGAWMCSPEKISFYPLDRNLLTQLLTRPSLPGLLGTIFCVQVATHVDRYPVPNVMGTYEVAVDAVHFLPVFPLDRGVTFRAIFDGRSLSGVDHQVLTKTEFCLELDRSSVPPARVINVFPSGDILPANMLRFTIHFSAGMRRGAASTSIRILNADGKSIEDVLYRAPIELWDREMRILTVLLDPGRLKRSVGPNVSLGPPLLPRGEYILEVGREIRDNDGRLLKELHQKRFRAGDAIRSPIAIQSWVVSPPTLNTREPLKVQFPNPLDRTLLLQSIVVQPKLGVPLRGSVSINRGETVWCFTPDTPWTDTDYRLAVRATLEDVCGNNLLAAFERVIGPATDSGLEQPIHFVPFEAQAIAKPAEAQNT